MQKNGAPLLLVIVTIFVFGLIAVIFFKGPIFEVFSPTSPKLLTPTPTLAPKFIINQRVKAAQGVPGTEKVGSLEFDHAPSVLEVLEKEHQVVKKTYDYGVMVESIDEIAGGKSNKYWHYSVNGRSGTMSADKFKLFDGDEVIWELK